MSIKPMNFTFSKNDNFSVCIIEDIFEKLPLRVKKQQFAKKKG